MKKIVIALALVVGISSFADAQRVSVRMSFPVGISIGAPGPAPFAGAVWIGPEWRWSRGQYVCAPGYWSRPIRNRARYAPGYWRHSRHGYTWVPGRWR
jgi:hypothetical protein